MVKKNKKKTQTYLCRHYALYFQLHIICFVFVHQHLLIAVCCPIGADIVGINCHFDPTTCLRGMKLMKDALDAAGLKPHLAVQPLAFHTPDAHRQGFIDLPEFPFGKFAWCSSLNYWLFLWRIVCEVRNGHFWTSKSNITHWGLLTETNYL